MATLIMLAGVIAVIAMARAFGASWSGARDYACAAVVLGVVMSTLSLRWRGGSVLLDVEPVKRIANLIVAAVAFTGAVYDFRNSNDVADGVFWVCVGILCLARALGRRQLREAGIRLDSHLVPWREITSYEVKDQDVVRLKLKHWPWRTKLRMPAGRHQEFLRLLDERTGPRPESAPASLP